MTELNSICKLAQKPIYPDPLRLVCSGVTNPRVLGDNFHATLVEEGSYLWRCLCYIELNMVRAGVVSHPREWEWVGYHEIMGQRKRYRLLDRVPSAILCDG
jgi:hypothetical protein